MTDSKKTGLFTSVSVGTATVWFSTHCGAGFASGTQELQFFANHGWFGPLLPVVSMVLLALTYYVGLETARQTDLWTYDKWSMEAFYPHGKIISKFMEFCIVLTSISATAACIAAGAQLLNQSFGISQFIASLIMFVIVTLLCIYGENLVRRNAMIMTGAILIIISIVLIAGLAKFWPDIVKNYQAGYVNPEAAKWSITGSSKETVHGNFFNSLLWALTYTGFQFAAIGGITSSFKGAKSKSESKGAMILGAIVNIIMLVGVCLLIFSHMPFIYTDEQAKLLPTVYIVQQLNISVLSVLYPVLLFLALITTAVGFTFGIVERFTPMVKIENVTARKALISVVYLAICLAISKLGLMWVVGTAYKYSGIFSWIFLIIPLWIFGYGNIGKRDRQQSA